MEKPSISQKAEDLYSEHNRLAKLHQTETDIMAHQAPRLEAAKANDEEAHTRYKRLSKLRPLGIIMPSIDTKINRADLTWRLAGSQYDKNLLDTNTTQSNIWSVERKLQANNTDALTFVENNPEIQDIAAQEAADAGIPLKR